MPRQTWAAEARAADRGTRPAPSAQVSAPLRATLEIPAATRMLCEVHGAVT